MKRLRNSMLIMIFLVPALLTGMSAVSARADSITFNFDGIFSRSAFTPASSFGTLTLIDRGNYVDLVVNLKDPSWKILELSLNYDDSKFNGYSAFSLANESLYVREDAIRMGGGYKGKFDIDIPGKGNIGTYGSYFDTISLDQGKTALHITDFRFTDTKNLVFAGLHIGNYNNGSSVWVGAGTVQPPAVPEPSTVLLIGFGLLAVFLLRKRCSLAYRKVTVKPAQPRLR